jgi:hypothetical protein
VFFAGTVEDMTAATLAEMSANAEDFIAESCIDAFGVSAVLAAPGKEPSNVYVYLTLRSDVRQAGRRTDNVEAMEVYLRKDPAHATQPGVAELDDKTELRLSDGRVYTYHNKILHEDTARWIIEMTRILPTNFGKR